MRGFCAWRGVGVVGDVSSDPDFAFLETQSRERLTALSAKLDRNDVILVARIAELLASNERGDDFFQTVAGRCSRPMWLSLA